MKCHPLLRFFLSRKRTELRRDLPSTVVVVVFHFEKIRDGLPGFWGFDEDLGGKTGEFDFA